MCGPPRHSILLRKNLHHQREKPPPPPPSSSCSSFSLGSVGLAGFSSRISGPFWPFGRLRCLQPFAFFTLLDLASLLLLCSLQLRAGRHDQDPIVYDVKAKPGSCLCVREKNFHHHRPPPPPPHLAALAALAALLAASFSALAAAASAFFLAAASALLRSASSAAALSAACFSRHAV